MVPNRLYPHYLLVKMYKEKGDLEMARKKAFILLKFHIKVPSKNTYMMIKYMTDVIK